MKAMITSLSLTAPLLLFSLVGYSSHSLSSSSASLGALSKVDVAYGTSTTPRLLKASSVALLPAATLLPTPMLKILRSRWVVGIGTVLGVYGLYKNFSARKNPPLRDLPTTAPSTLPIPVLLQDPSSHPKSQPKITSPHTQGRTPAPKPSPFFLSEKQTTTKPLNIGAWVYEKPAAEAEALISMHELSKSQDLYPRLSEAVFSSMMHLADREKLLFTREDLSLLKQRFGKLWLKDVLVHRRYDIFIKILQLKAQNARRAFEYLSKRTASYPTNLKRYPSMTLPQGVEDFAQNQREQQKRWNSSDRLLKILLHHQRPHQNLEYTLNDFYEERLLPHVASTEELSYGKEEKIINLHQHMALVFKQGFLHVFSKYNYFKPPPQTPFPEHIVLTNGLSSLELGRHQGLMSVTDILGPLKKQGLVRIGDKVLAARVYPNDTHPGLQAPLLFTQTPKHPLMVIAKEFEQAEVKLAQRGNFLGPKALRPSSVKEALDDLETHENFLILTLLRHQEHTQEYELVEAPIFRSSTFLSSLLNPLAHEPKTPGKSIANTKLFSAQLQGTPSGGDVAVLKIHTLSLEPEAMSLYEEDESLTFYKSMGAITKRDALEGMIIDLRDNFGGYVYLVQEILNAFCDTNKRLALAPRRTPFEFCHTTNVAQWAQEKLQPVMASINLRMMRRHLPQTQSHIPIVVLVNENTASAAEVLALELRAHRNALIVGSPTAGKGTVMVPFSVNHKEHHGSWVATFLQDTKNPTYNLISEKIFAADGTSPHSIGVPIDIELSSPWHLSPRLKGSDFNPPKLFDESLPFKPLEPLVGRKAPQSQLILELKEEFQTYINQGAYFTALKDWKEKRLKQQITSKIYLNPGYFHYYPFHRESWEEGGDSFATPNIITPPDPEDFTDTSWHLSEDEVLDQALWITQRYGELLRSYGHASP